MLENRRREPTLRRKRNMTDHAERFAEAVALGQIADLEFEEELDRCKALPRRGRSPLDVLVEIETPFVLGRMNA